MIIVTGGAGFIGSNIVRALNLRGKTRILIVDDLTDGRKCRNLQSLTFDDYMDHATFRKHLEEGGWFPNVEAVFHQGACSDTMEYNGRYVMEQNFEFSKILFHATQKAAVPFIYASSASTYGNKRLFKEVRDAEEALNPYAFSKLFFDRYITRHLPSCHSQVVGLRYFNVYGPQENHKDRMASLVRQMYYQLVETGAVTLFGEYDGVGPGEQTRDFIYVDDVVRVNLYFLDHPEHSGIYNCGTGHAHSFNELMQALIQAHGTGTITYTPFPKTLKGKYQSYTQADTSKLLSTGFPGDFTPLEKAVAAYVTLLKEHDGFYC